MNLKVQGESSFNQLPTESIRAPLILCIYIYIYLEDLHLGVARKVIKLFGFKNIFQVCLRYKKKIQLFHAL